jgi:hypothetical protein
MNILLWLWTFTFSTWILWVFFVALAHIKLRFKNLNVLSKVFAIPTLVIGFLFDIVTNVMFSLVFLDIPRELTLSRRLNRYMHDLYWRRKVAVFLAEQLINDFDENHIRINEMAGGKGRDRNKDKKVIEQPKENKKPKSK